MSIEPTAAVDSFGNVSAAADQETVFYEGSPKLRGETGLLAKCVGVAIVLIAIPILTYSTGHRAPALLWLICFALAAIALTVPLLLVRNHKYRISNYRIDHEEGLLSKRIDTIELWHVEDVDMEQSLFDRILGVGTITIRSNDATTPVLPLKSLPEPRKLLDAIKQRIIAVKRQRGVVKFDGAGNATDAGGDAHHHPHG